MLTNVTSAVLMQWMHERTGSTSLEKVTLKMDSDGTMRLVDWPADVPMPTQEWVDANRASAETWLAAYEAEERNKPMVFPRPIQARIETPALDGHVYGLEVDPTDGGVFTVQRESTRLTQPEYEAAKAAILAQRKAARDAAKAESDSLKSKLAELKAKLATAEADIGELKKGR